MKKQYLECGKVVSTHGITGEIKVQSWCDTPEDLLNIKNIYFGEGTGRIEIERIRIHKGMGIFKIVGVNSIEDAQSFRGKILFASREDLSVEEGEYFIQDLIGISVFDVDDGTLYGTLDDVTETGANDVYHIKFADGETRLIPVIPDVIIETNIDEGFIKIRPLKGLFEDED